MSCRADVLDCSQSGRGLTTLGQVLVCRFWRGTVAAGRGPGHVHTLHVVPSTFISMSFFNIIVNTMDPYSYRSVGSMEDLNCWSNRKYCQGLNEC